MATTFLLTVLAWVAFRADSLGDALTIYGTMASAPSSSSRWYAMRGMAIAGSCIAFMLLLEWWNRGAPVRPSTGCGDRPSGAAALLLRHGVHAVRLRPMDSGQFIYFQF